MIRKKISKEHEENDQMKNQLPNNKATGSSSKNDPDSTQKNQTVKENGNMPEETVVVEENKNEEEVKIDLVNTHVSTEVDPTLDSLPREVDIDPTFGTKILGGVRQVKGKKPGTGRTRKDGIAEHARKYIVENYPKSNEFVTHDLSEYLKNEHGLKSTDISGQLYGLKKSNWIKNREPNDEEIKILGKGVKIWRGTDKLYEYYADDLKVAETTDEYKMDEGSE